MDINLTLIAQAISFAVFILFSVKFVWPPLMKAIEERQKQIADGLAAGEQGRQSLASTEKRIGELKPRAGSPLKRRPRRARALPRLSRMPKSAGCR